MALAIAALAGLAGHAVQGKNSIAGFSVSITRPLLMAGLVMLLFLTHPDLVQQHVRWYEAIDWALYWLPTFWFTGLYGAVASGGADNPALTGLGTIAIQALLCAAAVFVLAYLPGYLPSTQRKDPGRRRKPDPSGPGRVTPGGLRCGGEPFCCWGRRAEERSIPLHPARPLRSSAKRSPVPGWPYGGFGGGPGSDAHRCRTPGLARLPLTLSFILASGLRAAFNFSIGDSGQLGCSKREFRSRVSGGDPQDGNRGLAQ